MDNKKKLIVPLLFLIIAVTVAGVGRLLWIGTQINGEGPLALAPVPQGGFLLSTGKTILEFDSTAALQHTQAAASLGLQEAGALQKTADGSLWVFDKGQRQLFQCTDTGLCSARSPRDLSLDKNAQFAVSADHDLVAIADNNNHRLLLLDKGGHLLLDSNGTPPLHYPNQLQFDGDALLVADSDRYAIKRIAVLQGEGLRLGTPETVLSTQRHPYRFAHDDTGWWVLEAGESLVDGKLYFYPASGPRRVVDTRATDAIDFLSNGDQLVLASRRDHLLLGMDKHSQAETMLGGATLNTRWQEQRQREQQLLRQRTLIPILMVAVLLPLLLGAALVEQKERKQAEASATPPVDAALPAALRAGRPVSLRPDALGRKAIVQERNAILGIALTVLLLAPGLCWLSAGMPSLVAWKQQELWPLLVIIFTAVPASLVGLYYAFQQQARKLSRELVFDATGVTLLETGRCFAKADYAQVRLTQVSLEIGGTSLPLYLNPQQRLSPFWPRQLLKNLLAQKTAPEPASLGPARTDISLQIAESDRRLLRRQLWLVRALVLAGLGAGLLMGIQMYSHTQTAGLSLLPLGGVLGLLLIMQLYMEQFSRNHTETRLVVKPDGLTVLRCSQPLISVPYTQVWLGENLLVAGDKPVRLVLRRNALKQRVIELFPLDQLRAALEPRLPADNRFDTDAALLLTLLKRRNRYAVVTVLRTSALIVAMLVFFYIDFRLKHP